VQKRRPIYRILLIVVAIAAFLIWQRSGKTTVTGDFDRNTAQLVFSRHARCRMDCRKIDESEVREVIKDGTINRQKSEPNSHPDPKYALEGVTHDGQHVRIVVAAASNKLVVVTVIDLDTEWTCHCN
jgi:Domain of unknown function (DUF4258)